MKNYEPRNWFWVVNGDVTRAWSSAASAYVDEWDQARASHIANEVELYDVLAKAGIKSRAPSRLFSGAEVREALLRIDAAATGEANDASSLEAVAEDIGVVLPPIA